MNLIFSTAVLLAGFAMMADGAESHNQSTASPFSDIWGVKIHVIDINEASDFYTGLLGFDIKSREHYPEAVVLRDQGAHVILVECETRTAFDPDTGTRLNLNLYVEDLPSFAEEMRASRVRVLDDTLRTAGVGKYVRILDPSGNQLHIMELGYDHEPVSKPTVYNVGARITDMKKSRAFYEGLLGFDVLSENYYPPVIPYKSKGIQLILHEGGETPTRPTYPQGSQTVLTMLTSDLDKALSNLRKAHIEPLLSSNIDGGSGRYNAVCDPDGNVIEILELSRDTK